MKPWKMPKWMEPYRPMICNTGGNDVTDMMNGSADPRVNLPLSTLQACVKSQVILLERLHDGDMLPPPAEARIISSMKRKQRELALIADSVDLVLTARAFASDPRIKKLRAGLEEIREAARRGLSA